jgi:hypothetical protein
MSPPAAAAGILLTYCLLILSSSCPTPPHSLNVTIPLLAQNFTIFSKLLFQTQLDMDLQDVPPGMTILVPADQEFYHISQSWYNRINNFTLNDRYLFVKGHILPSYLPLNPLRSTQMFMQQTLATLNMGSQTFLLNISGINGSVVQIDTGVVRAVITRTVYDHRPNVIYEVSKVLLSPDLFGKNHVATLPHHSPSPPPPPPPVSSSVATLPMLMVMTSCLLLLLLFVFY